MTAGDGSGQAMSETYWSEVEREGRSVLDHIRADADDWDVRGAVVTGEDEQSESVYVLVLRTRVGDEGLLLSERFYRFDIAACEGHWTSNGVTRRVQGSLIPSLAVLYKSLSAGDATSESPMLMDAREDDLDHSAALLTDPAGDLADEPDEDDGESFDALREDPDARRSVEGSRTTQPATVDCDQCGAELPRSEAINMGSGLGVDLWICDGSHQEDPHA